MKSSTYGSSHFVSRSAAFKYYAPYGYTRDQVSQKITAGEIFTGKPEIAANQNLSINVEEGRYFVITYEVKE